MQLSANYSLKLMEGTDNVKRQDFVDNFTAIDTQMKIINDNGYPPVTATGTNVYTGSTDRIKSLGKGTKLTLFVGTDATGNCTLNLNSYGVKNIKDNFGNIVNNLKKDIPYNLCYNGTDFILQGKGGGGDALPSQLLLGKKATVDSGPIVGTLDLSNLVSGNIKSGVTINGVNGSSTVVDTADAVLDPQYLVVGQSGYDDGVKKNGTLVSKAGYETAVNTWASGTGNLHFHINKGAYVTGSSGTSGVYPEIQGYDADFIASNIISGKNIFGLAGTATPESLGGMTAVSGSVYLTYQGASDSSVIQLPYAPSRVVVYFPYTLGIRGAGYWLASEGLASSGVHTSNDHSAGSIAISGTTMTLTSYYYAGTRYWVAFA